MRSAVLSVPNQLTFLRLGFLPFYIICINYERYAWALGLLIVAAISDLLDGVLARRLDQKTRLGAYLDPIADKLLLSSSFIILALKGHMPWWLTILVLSRDVLILMTAAVIMIAMGYRPFPPSFYGKVTTVTQILLVVLVLSAALLDNQWLAAIRNVFIYLVAAFTVFSGVHYSVAIARRLHSS